jgi:hypothetical protein
MHMGDEKHRKKTCGLIFKALQTDTYQTFQCQKFGS